MRIDSHISLWKQVPESARRHLRFPGDERAFLPEHIAPILTRNRFDGGLLISTGTETAEIDQLVAWCEESTILKGIVHAWGEGASKQETDALQAVLRGYWVEAGSSALHEAAAHCETKGLALDVIPGKSEFEPGSLAATARSFPRTPFLVAHAGCPPLEHEALAEWMASMRSLAEEPNVHVKLSGLWSTAFDKWNIATLQSLVVFLIEQFGERRLLFGSDWPFCLPAHSWKECLARFTQSIGARTMDFREFLLGENAARIYGLPTSVSGANSAGSSLP